MVSITFFKSMFGSIMIAYALRIFPWRIFWMKVCHLLQTIIQNILQGKIFKAYAIIIDPNIYLKKVMLTMAYFFEKTRSTFHKINPKPPYL